MQRGESRRDVTGTVTVSWRERRILGGTADAIFFPSGKLAANRTLREKIEQAVRESDSIRGVDGPKVAMNRWKGAGRRRKGEL